MKKLFSTSLFLCLSCLCMMLWAQNNVITYTASEKLQEANSEEGGVGLHLDAFNVAVTGHTFADGAGTITFAGDLTTIGDDAFFDCFPLEIITLPATVTTIGDRAFHTCGRISDIALPASVTTIGEEAFIGCNGLSSITL